MTAEVSHYGRDVERQFSPVGVLYGKMGLLSTSDPKTRVCLVDLFDD